MKRFLHSILLLVFTGAIAFAEGPTPPPDAAASSSNLMAIAEAPLLPQPTRLQQMTYMIKGAGEPRYRWEIIPVTR
jgi:hypothetical protein